VERNHPLPERRIGCSWPAIGENEVQAPKHKSFTPKDLFRVGFQLDKPGLLADFQWRNPRSTSQSKNEWEADGFVLAAEGYFRMPSLIAAGGPPECAPAAIPILIRTVNEDRTGCAGLAKTGAAQVRPYLNRSMRNQTTIETFPLQQLAPSFKSPRMIPG
jgi:hypothetical protein